MSETTRQHIDLELLANFVHQVINPLNGVIGTVDNIIEGEVPNDKKDQRLRAVRAQLEHAVLLIRNLAYFSRLSLAAPGTVVQEKQLTDKESIVPQVVIEAAMYFQELANSQRIEIRLTDKRTQYSVPGVPELLRQVFMNLFDNGIKYSDRDSEILISPHIQKHSNTLIVEVISQGIGFDFSERETLFDPGYRSMTAKEKVLSGTGLGLYICKKILEDVFQGSIEAEYSPQSRKTVFRIRFPKFKIK